METISHWYQHYSNEAMLVQQVFLICFITLLANYVARRLLKKLQDKSQQTKMVWDDCFIIAISKPLATLIWLIGLGFAVRLIEAHTQQAFLFSMVDPAQKVATIAIFAWFFLRLVNQFEKVIVDDAFFEKKNVDRTTADAVGKILRLSIVITSVLISLQTLHIQISGLLAVGGAGSLIAGLAAKDLLANFFGSLMVYFDRPFAVGDWIRSPDKSIEGTVENIGWRLTRIRTFDKRPLYVPNAVFTTIAIENPSRMQNRRIKETIGLRYDDIAVVDKVLQSVETMLRNHPEIDTTQTLMVNLNQFGASSIDFFVYTFTKTTDWVRFHQIKQDVLLQIANIIREHDADIAFPTSTLHIEPFEMKNRSELPHA